MVAERVEAVCAIWVDLEITRYWLDWVKIGRDDALAEGVVQRVVDRRRGDAEARRRVAVDRG